MTDEQKLANLQFKFDFLQNRVAHDHARTDELVATMNAFIIEVRSNLCNLLHAQIVDPSTTENK